MLLLEIEPGFLVLPSGRVLEIASTVVMTDDSTGVTPRVGSTADFGAVGAGDNTRGFSTLQTLLSGVAECGRSALLVRIDLDVRTVRMECHFNGVARGLCL